MKTLIFTKNLGRLALLIPATIFINGTILNQVSAREANLDTLCQKFPLNSRCQEYRYLTVQPPKVVKLRLKTSGPDNEWIRLEMSGNTIKLLHTTRAKTTFSKVLNGLASVAPVPVPSIFNFSRWYDHPTTRITFVSDSCIFLQRLKLLKNSVLQTTHNSSFPSCAITGTDSVFLTQGMDIRRGWFTIEYKEEELLRAITFRIPSDDS